MLKFFRTIRQKLLAQHKIGQYLKYAIGETILIVVGILIALQIDNWNENRKEKADVKTHLQNLIADLKSDIITSNVYLSDTDPVALIKDHPERIAIIHRLMREAGWWAEGTG